MNPSPKGARRAILFVMRVVLGTAAILAVPLVAMQFTDQVDWSAADFVLAGLLLAVIGVAIETAVKRAGSIPLAAGIAALGVAAGAFGMADDAPGLVLLGIALVAGACALGARVARRA